MVVFFFLLRICYEQVLFFYAKISQQNPKEQKMKINTSPQLSEVLYHLANINDNLRKQNDLLAEISQKLSDNGTKLPSSIKHLVVVKKSQETPKKELNKGD